MACLCAAPCAPTHRLRRKSRCRRQVLPQGHHNLTVLDFGQAEHYLPTAQRECRRRLRTKDHLWLEATSAILSWSPQVVWCPRSDLPRSSLFRVSATGRLRASHWPRSVGLRENSAAPQTVTCPIEGHRVFLKETSRDGRLMQACPAQHYIAVRVDIEGLLEVHLLQDTSKVLECLEGPSIILPIGFLLCKRSAA